MSWGHHTQGVVRRNRACDGWEGLRQHGHSLAGERRPRTGQTHRYRDRLGLVLFLCWCRGTCQSTSRTRYRNVHGTMTPLELGAPQPEALRMR